MGLPDAGRVSLRFILLGRRVFVDHDGHIGCWACCGASRWHSRVKHDPPLLGNHCQGIHLNPLMISSSSILLTRAKTATPSDITHSLFQESFHHTTSLTKITLKVSLHTFTNNIVPSTPRVSSYPNCWKTVWVFFAPRLCLEMYTWKR